MGGDDNGDKKEGRIEAEEIEIREERMMTGK